VQQMPREGQERTNFGSFATFAAILRASSFDSNQLLLPAKRE